MLIVVGGDLLRKYFTLPTNYIEDQKINKNMHETVYRV